MVTHSFRTSVVWSTVLTLFIALAAIALVPHAYAQDAEPGAVGAENGRPFQALQEQIDELTADLQAQIDSINGKIAILETDIADAVSKLSLLETDVFANADEIAALEDEIDLKQELISDACPESFAIRLVNADGTVVCEMIDFTTTIFSMRVFDAVSIPPEPAQGSALATCPAGWTVSGGGFAGGGSIRIRRSRPSGLPNGWITVGRNESSNTRQLVSFANCLRH